MGSRSGHELVLQLPVPVRCPVNLHVPGCWLEQYIVVGLLGSPYLASQQCRGGFGGAACVQVGDKLQYQVMAQSGALGCHGAWWWHSGGTAEHWEAWASPALLMWGHGTHSLGVG